MSNNQTFRESVQLAMLFLAVIVILIFTNEAARAGGGVEFWNKPCLKAYKEWQKRTRHKAFAVSNTSLDNSGQTCGYSWGHPNKAAAEKAALLPCKKGHFSSTCRITASE